MNTHAHTHTYEQTFISTQAYFVIFSSSSHFEYNHRFVAFYSVVRLVRFGLFVASHIQIVRVVRLTQWVSHSELFIAHIFVVDAYRRAIHMYTYMHAHTIHTPYKLLFAIYRNRSWKQKKCWTLKRASTQRDARKHLHTRARAPCYSTALSLYSALNIKSARMDCMNSSTSSRKKVSIHPTNDSNVLQSQRLKSLSLSRSLRCVRFRFSILPVCSHEMFEMCVDFDVAL